MATIRLDHLTGQRFLALVPPFFTRTPQEGTCPKVQIASAAKNNS